MISLIIPTRNRANVLIELLIKLNHQIGEFEVIIIDDASYDNTLELVKSKSKSLKYKLKIIKMENQVGLPIARNIGINNSSGDSVGFLDDDCIPIRNDLLFRASKWLLSKGENIIGVGGPTYLRSTKPNKTFFKIKNIKEIFNIKFYFKIILYLLLDSKIQKLHYTKYLPGGNFFFKKEYLLKVNGFDPRFDGNHHKEDDDICISLEKYGNLIFDPKMCVNHLKIDTGGCRREIESYLPNSISNSILLITKHKKITLRTLIVFFYHLERIFYYLLVRREDSNDRIDKKLMVRNLIQSIPKGLLKHTMKKKKQPTLSIIYEN